MDPDTIILIQNHGYWIISLAVILFDIPAALAAGYLVGRGQIELLPAALALFIGRLSFEVVLIYFARYRLNFLIKIIPRLENLLDKGAGLVKRYPFAILSVYHFVIGTKLAVPLALGVNQEQIKIRKFIFFNSIGLLIWIVVMMAAGFSFAAMRLS
jgi:membrane protein DedA with SNARE-associated domain